MNRPLIMFVWQRAKQFCAVSFCLAALCASSLVQAVEVAGLYRVDLPVASQQQNERKRASSAGLKRVIQRITGDTAAFNEAQVQQALQRPERYLRQYSYYQATNSTANERQHLRLLFDETLVNRLLRQVKQPIWGDNRPGLMMWVAVEGRGDRHLISAGENSPWQTAVEQAGQDSGIPILLPLMDLEDESNISVMDVWGLFRNKLEQASVRYRSEAVLAGRLYQTTSDQWAGRWLLLLGDEAISFVTPGTAIQNSASEALAQVASIMAKRYAIDTSVLGATHIKLAVEGIKNLQDYARVTAYLKAFAMVDDVAVSHVEGERLTLVLITEGEWQKLKDVIALDNRLVPVPEAAGEFADGLMVMTYQWRP